MSFFDTVLANAGELDPRRLLKALRAALAGPITIEITVPAGHESLLDDLKSQISAALSHPAMTFGARGYGAPGGGGESTLVLTLSAWSHPETRASLEELARALEGQVDLFESDKSEEEG